MEEEPESIPWANLQSFANRLGNRGLPLTAEFGFHDAAPLFTFYQK
jgi:hypothetical protein